MNNRLLSLSAAAIVALLSGCATPTKMAFYDDSQRLTEKSKPVYLMTATIKNSYVVSYQPRLIVVHVSKQDAKEAADHLNFTMDEKAKNETGSETAGNSYLLRLELDPGDYSLGGFTSIAGYFPLRGMFFTPIRADLKVTQPGVYYLGHVNATVRERKDNEFRAGGVIPLIDQIAVGASGGTFDVEITDEFATDEALFRSRFPALATADIQKVVLPAFDRDKIQRMWEGQDK